MSGVDVFVYHLKLCQMTGLGPELYLRIQGGEREIIDYIAGECLGDNQGLVGQ